MHGGMPKRIKASSLPKLTAGLPILLGSPVMWVFILFYVRGGNPPLAMHDFSNRSACKQTLTKAVAIQNELKGTSHTREACVPKAMKAS